MKKTIEEFYNKNKENKIVLSKEEIIAISNSWFSINSYRSMSEWKEHFPQMIFGLKDGGVFTASNFILLRKGKLVVFDYRAMKTLNVSSSRELTVKGITFSFLSKTKLHFELFLSLKEEVVKTVEQQVAEQRKKVEQQDAEQKKKEEAKNKKRVEKLNTAKSSILQSLDKDGNGEVDAVEGNDFNTLLKKHQKTILEIDRNYVKKFVKISTYLKDKKANIQDIFNSIGDTPNQSVLNEYVGILKNEVNTYHMILANGLTMLVALIEDDVITYEEIYESMDRINLFDSQWEKDVSQKLTNIGDGLNALMYEIEASNRRIVNELSNLTYATEQGFSELNSSITSELQSIDSSIKVNNLLTGIQTYQMYKINKNTKSLRG